MSHNAPRRKKNNEIINSPTPLALPNRELQINHWRLHMAPDDLHEGYRPKFAPGSAGSNNYNSFTVNRADLMDIDRPVPRPEAFYL